MNDHQSIEDKLILLELRADEMRLRAAAEAWRMVYDALFRVNDCPATRWPLKEDQA